MRIFYTTLLFISSIIFSDIDRNSIADQMKPIWSDAVIVLNHQFRLVEGLGKIKSYLCLFRASDYIDNNNNGLFVNLEHDGNPIGHKVMVDTLNCETTKSNTPWIYRAQQASSDAPLIIDMFNSSETPTSSLDTRARLVQEENADAANPYGILTLDYGLVSKVSDPENPSTTAFPLYAATYESTRLPDNNIQFKTAMYVDGVVSTGVTAGFVSEFYSSTIIHTPNQGGEGTVTSRIFLNANGPDFIYPGGTPNSALTTNFAYDENYLLYAYGAGEERCINKSKSATWDYVIEWGYGIYNSTGDRVSFTNLVTAPYTDPETGIAATLLINGGNIQIDISSNGIADFICKKVKDGSPLDGINPCPGGVTTIGGERYENFPPFDIIDGTTITASDGNEYYIRVLRPRLVWSEVPITNCATLTVPSSKETPDHTFFNFVDLTIPRSGAILVNELDGTAYYSKDGDQDADGVPNYLDAFPTDDTKSRDDDYDGLDNDNDNEFNLYQINFDKKLNVPMLPIPN